MNINELEKLNVNNAFSNKFDKYLKPRLDAIKAQSLERGRVIQPILAWGNEVVYGHSLVVLVRENPTLECNVIYVEYKDCQEAGADVTTYVCTFEELITWDKLVLSVDCGEYWYLVDAAKQNRGTRTDLDKDSESKFKTAKVNEIIGKKVRVSATLVSKFKTIYGSDQEDLKKQCEEGLAITTAYDLLKSRKDKKKSDDKPDTVKVKTPKKIEILRNCKIFEECEKLPPSNKKAAAVIHEDGDYKVIADKIARAKLPAGRIWVAVDRNKGALHMASKTSDEATGKVTVKVDCFECSFVESFDGLYILAADFAFGPEQYNRKDETDFENISKEGTPIAIPSDTATSADAGGAK